MLDHILSTPGDIALLPRAEAHDHNGYSREFVLKSCSVGDEKVIRQETMLSKAEALISATNAFDVDAVLALFTPEAMIDDPSTGERFNDHIGIRDYFERFFVGYHTITRLLSTKVIGIERVRIRVDFTGDFGHEIGLLDMSFNSDGLIVRIDADLE